MVDTREQLTSSQREIEEFLWHKLQLSARPVLASARSVCPGNRHSARRLTRLNPSHRHRMSHGALLSLHRRRSSECDEAAQPARLNGQEAEQCDWGQNGSSPPTGHTSPMPLPRREGAAEHGKRR
eukprot:scaffold10823_cov35-Tisochrysis_lutea.AAC.2